MGFRHRDGGGFGVCVGPPAAHGDGRAGCWMGLAAGGVWLMALGVRGTERWQEVKQDLLQQGTCLLAPALQEARLTTNTCLGQKNPARAALPSARGFPLLPGGAG